MSLTTSQRNAVYEYFAPRLGEEVAEALLSQYPTNDLEVPATKDFVRAEIGLLRSDLHHEIGLLRSELHSEIGLLRTEMHREVGLLRTELHGEIGALRTDLHRELRLHLVATLSFVGALLTAFRLL